MAKIKLKPERKKSTRNVRNGIYFSKSNLNKNKAIQVYGDALKMSGFREKDSVSISYDSDRNTLFIEEDKTSSLSIRRTNKKLAIGSLSIGVQTIPFERFGLFWPSQAVVDLSKLTIAPGCISFIWPNKK